MERVKGYLLNIREIIGILVNILFNHIKVIICKRVVYSKEDFNFETYVSQAMHDDRLVRNAIFLKSGK